MHPPLKTIFGKPLHLLLKPWSIAAIVTAIILFLFFPEVQKYTLEIDEINIRNNTKAILWDDLDGNGASDRIALLTYASQYEKATVQIEMKPATGFNEWDFHGNFNYFSKSAVLAGDFDNNGIKEVYTVYLRHDSLFLVMIMDPFNHDKPCRHRFLTTVTMVKDAAEAQVSLSQMKDVNLDGHDDLIFSINGGFSVRPRNLYIYDPTNDSLLQSAPIGFYCMAENVIDINNDKFPEFLMDGYAIQNVEDTVQYPIHDKNTWLIIYNHNLEFLFPPIRFPHKGYCGISFHTLDEKSGKPQLFFSYAAPQASKVGTIIGKIDARGVISNQCTIPEGGWGNSNVIKVKVEGREHLAIKTRTQETIILDTSLNIVQRRQIGNESDGHLRMFDLDGDGENEIVILDNDHAMLHIMREDLSHPVELILPGVHFGNPQFSVQKDRTKDMERLVIFNGTHEYFISYAKNPYYYLRWGVYLAIFAAIYLFILLIRKIQRDQFIRKQRTEKKITELQMKVVRNQLDPHFTMNAVNSVIAAIDNNEKEQATRHLIHFSKMYRHLVTTADRIKCTLAEELEFTQNYITMEQFRFRNKFGFEPLIDPDVDLNLEVPKMVIQSPVENAIKHGLLNLPENGMLTISVTTRDRWLILEITDNGIGRKNAAQSPKKSTGKGMKAMNEFLTLYQKTTGTRIETRIEDAFPDVSDRPGTKVTVKIEIPAEIKSR